MMKHLALAAFGLFAIAPALAASDDAWAEFQAKVERECLAATSGILSDAAALVDPFGSEHYGLAIVSGQVSGGGTRSIICAMDKASGEVEIGGELEHGARRHSLREICNDTRTWRHSPPDGGYR
jgi:hypothetical protein